MSAIAEESQVQLHVSLTELGVISREGRRQGTVEGNGRRGKKSMIEETGQNREPENIYF